MTSVRMQHRAKSRPVGFPSWLKLVLLGMLLAFCVLGLLLVDEYVQQSSLRTTAYGLLLVVGAVALGLMLLRFDELRQLRRWNAWKCPLCSAKYQLRQFSAVRFWGTEKKKTRAGVLLICSQCDRETAFDEAGNVRRQA